MPESNELALTLSNLQDFIRATMSLYDGRLVRNETELFFIAERFSGWEIMERCELSDVQKVEVKDSFMGAVVEIHTSGSHWSLKDMAEGVDVEQWIKGRLSTDTFSNTEQSNEQEAEKSPESVVMASSSDGPGFPQQTPISQSNTTAVSENTQGGTSLEASEEDLDRMRQIFAINPKMQVLMAKVLDEPFDGTDAQIRRLF